MSAVVGSCCMEWNHVCPTDGLRKALSTDSNLQGCAWFDDMWYLGLQDSVCLRTCNSSEYRHVQCGAPWPWVLVSQGTQQDLTVSGGLWVHTYSCIFMRFGISECMQNSFKSPVPRNFQKLSSNVYLFFHSCEHSPAFLPGSFCWG